jgi:hypothetical protein
MGFTPIGGDDFIFEADASIMFMPQASGVPTWSSELRGEKKGIKLPDEFKGILDDGAPISWRHGVRLAQWLNAGNAVARDGASRPMSSARTDEGVKPEVVSGAPGSEAGTRRPASDPPGVSTGRTVKLGSRVYDPETPAALHLLADMDLDAWRGWGGALYKLIAAASTPGLKFTWIDLNREPLLRLQGALPPAAAAIREVMANIEHAGGTPTPASGDAVDGAGGPLDNPAAASPPFSMGGR